MHEDAKPTRPWPVATQYRDGTPVGKAPDALAVRHAINHGGTVNLREEARRYYALVDEARAAGVPTSLDDPDSPKTVDALRAAVEATR